jgi:hypothetical protein
MTDPFEVSGWPRNSPNLNPRENCQKFLKEKLKEQGHRDCPKLIQEIKMLWTPGLSKEYLKSLNDDTPRRIQLALAVMGDAIWLLMKSN